MNFIIKVMSCSIKSRALLEELNRYQLFKKTIHHGNLRTV